MGRIAIILGFGLAAIISGCAQASDPVIDYRIDHGLDGVPETVPETPADVPVETPVDLRPDPVVDTAPDPVVDLTPDPVVDTAPDPVVDLTPDTVPDTGTCTESPCGLKPNCGCPAGQKCSLDDTGGRACMTAGTGTLRSTCVDDSGCAAGYICLLTSSTGTTGACYPYCDTDGDCTGTGSICFQLYLGTTPIDAFVCSYACDLLTSSGCPAGHSCDFYMIDDDGDGVGDRGLTDCNSEVGAGTQGSYCTSDAECASAYFCDASYSATCLAYCYYATGSCPSSTTCYSSGFYLGSNEVGYCDY
jgi:hypothetical protein